MPISGLPNILPLRPYESQRPLDSALKRIKQVNSLVPLTLADKINPLPIPKWDQRAFNRSYKMQQFDQDMEDPNARLSEARSSLLKATLFGVLGNFAQKSKFAIPKMDDSYLDKMDREIPQHIKDYQNSQIDRTTRGVVSNVLANAPLNRAANTIAVADANAATAKANLAVTQGQEEVRMNNQYLTAKQRRLDSYNGSVADAENRMTEAKNTQNANFGALGTNYYNELQRARANEYAIYDRNKYLRSGGLNNIAMLKQVLGGVIR